MPSNACTRLRLLASSLTPAALALAVWLSPTPAEANGRLTATTESGDLGELDLLEERLTITIDRQYADTTLRQVYSNHSESRLEGRYTLQAGEGAKVHGFSYWNGEDRIVGEVLENSTATEIYEEVPGLGGDPGLLTESGGIEDGQPMSAKRHAAYEKRVEELNAQMGEPILSRMSGDELMRTYDWINARLREEGREVELEGMDRMSDEELARHFDRIQQLTQAYEALN